MEVVGTFGRHSGGPQKWTNIGWELSQTGSLGDVWNPSDGEIVAVFWVMSPTFVAWCIADTTVPFKPWDVIFWGSCGNVY